ncbi:MAG: c-type cytochrome, partial [Halioglobus sp.]|nr:c-type cytochrome [Halioglobus sp.]
TGKFDVLCMELCGIAHYAMRGYVVIDEQEDFDQWVATQPTWADMQAIPPGDPVAGKANYAVCASCHGQQGEGNLAMNAPRLAGLPDWYVTRQLDHYKAGIRGAHEQDTYGQQMAHMANMLDQDAAVRNVNAYIETREAGQARNTLGGDAKKGAAHYVSCGACHGAAGEGNFALQAPRLAGQDDWYLKRQLENFRLGIRGAHKEDSYGHQMVLMARSLQDEQSIDNLMAYLSSL